MRHSAALSQQCHSTQRVSWAWWQHQYSNDPGLTCWQSGRTQLRNVSWGAAPCQSPLRNSYILHSSAAYMSVTRNICLCLIVMMIMWMFPPTYQTPTTSQLNITQAAVSMSIKWCPSQNTWNSIFSWISVCLLKPCHFIGYEIRRGRFLLFAALGSGLSWW